jgi:YesN/AraC family two-component response regulator
MQKNPVIVISEKESQELYRNLFADDERIEVLSCEQALDLSKCQEADMLLFDCGFAPETALALMKQLKSLMPHVPIIFITDVSSENIAINAFRAGAFEYFRKPVNLFSLQDTIERLLTVKRTELERRRRVERLESEDISSPITTDMPASLLRAIHYIEHHLSSAITLKALADEANVSKYYFCRLFKHHTGLSPKKFIVSRRIERAKELLNRKEDMNVSLVAMEVGFNDVSYFIRAFRKMTGTTPARLKKFTTILNR